MESSRVILLLIGICCLTLVGPADAKCCYAKQGFCADGSRKVGDYCGKGPCNIYGCECQGGCKGGSWDRVRWFID